MKYFLETILILFVLSLALACGRPAGSKGESSGLSIGEVRLKSEKSLPIPSTATISLVELGGEQSTFVDRVSISSGNIAVLIPRDVDCLLILEVDNMPFLRTTLSANQITQARVTKVIDPGEFNAVTTYLTGVLETQVNGSRRSKGNGRQKVGIDSFIAENFGSSATSFADLTYSKFQTQAIQTSEAFRQRINRINLLKVYFHTFRNFTGVNDSGRSAVKSLYAALFDELDPNRLINAIASPNLPSFTGKGDSAIGVAQLQTLAQESLFIYQNGALTVEELGSLFFDPAGYMYLVDKALFSPTGQIVGSVVGQQLEGVSIELTSSTGFKAKATTGANGHFQIDGLSEGSYTLSASGPSLIFDVPQRTVTLLKAESLQGVNFVNIIDRGAVTVQPSSSAQVLAEGYYSSVQVTGDGNLSSPNILQGVTVFGVTGTANISSAGLPSGGNATSAQVLAGQTAYAGGQLITGTLPTVSLSAHSSTVPAGYQSATTLPQIDADLVPTNIVSGANIFGVQGTASVGSTGNTTTSVSSILLYQGKMAGGAFSLEHQ